MRMWLLCLTAGVLWGCALAPSPRETREPGDWRGVERLVLAPFSGDHGEILQRALFERLTVEGGLKAVYLEDRLWGAPQNLEDPEGRRGRLITWQPTADAVVSARTRATIIDSPGADRVEVREGTGQFRQIRNVDGDWVSVEIMRTRLRRVPFVVRQATLSADFRLDHLRQAGMSFESSVTVAGTEKYGGDSPLPITALPAADASAQALAERLAARMALEIAGGPFPQP
ncbi:MAG: hypothetical protein PVI39_02090 [Desulfobacteraceae bacterium]